MSRFRLRSAIRACGWHLLGSVAMAAVAAWIVFGQLYPSPYAQMLGGFQLFLILISVDVVCGPLLTLVLFNPTKPRRELILDLGLVVILQLGALVYGIHTAWLARPVYLIYDVDRFHVVTMSELDIAELEKKPDSIPAPYWSGGPMLIGSRTAKPEDSDYMEQVNKSLAGNDAFLRAERWQSYSEFKDDVLEHAKPLSMLYKKFPSKSTLLDKVLLAPALDQSQIVWVPVLSRRGGVWTVLLDGKTAQPIKFLPLDAF